jgi:hypothetical protein
MPTAASLSYSIHALASLFLIGENPPFINQDR